MLLRHGESSDDPSLTSLPDHQRPLTARGEEESRRLGAALLTNGVEPSLILVSDTVRSRQTLDCLAERGGPAFAHARVSFQSSLYVAAAMDGETAGHLLGVITAELSEADSQSAACVLCIGHNKGWEEAASEFTGEAVRLSTASAAVLASKQGGSWALALAAGGHEWALESLVCAEQ